MVRRDGAEMRKERMQEIARHIQRSLATQSGISLSGTVAILQYEYGLTRDKIMEYLAILEKLGQFTLDHENDKIRKTNQA